MQAGATRHRAVVGFQLEALMVTIHWSSRYETGILEIDRKHLQQFQVMNDLIESFRRGDPQFEARKLLGFLVTYVREHVHTEETWMAEHGYPGLEAHKLEHEAFKAQVAELGHQFETGHDLTMKVTVLMADWLNYHVDGCDLDLARHSRA